MKRITFSMPLVSIVSVSLGFSMLWVFLTTLNAIRFTQCAPWGLLQPPPEKPAALLGTPLNRLYVETQNKSVYCLKKGQWANCLHPGTDSQPDLAPDWLISNFGSAIQPGELAQVIRVNGFPDVTYYSLHKDGQIFSCSTNVDAEAENIFRSGMFAWLLIPLLGMIWSITSFVNLFIKYGSPTLWDFWGRGEKIK